MPDREIKLVYRITDDGTIKVLNTVEQSVENIGTKASASSAQAGAAFGSLGGKALALGAAVGVVTGAFAAAEGAAAGIVNKIHELDHIGETAKAIGLTTTELSSLRLAAQQGGVPLETLGRSAAFFARQMVEATDKTSKQGQIFSALGIDVHQGLLPALVQLGQQFDKLPDGPVKTKLAFDLLSRGGLASLNVINGALADQIKLNEQLGATIDEKTAGAIGNAADALDRADLALGAVGETLAARVAPSIAAAADGTTSWATSVTALVKSDLAGWVEDVSGKAQTLLTLLGPLGQGFGNLVGVSGRLLGFAIRVNDGNGPGAGPFASGTPSFPPTENSDDITAAVQRARYNEQLRKLLGDPDKPPSGGNGGAGHLATLTDQSLVGAQQALVTNAQTELTVDQQALDVFQRRVALENTLATTQQQRLTILNENEQQELALAQAIDAAKSRELDAQLAVLEAKKEDHDVVEAASKGLTGQLDLINAQEDSLRAQKDILNTTGGEAAKVADQYARGRAELEAANKVAINLGDTLDSSIGRAVDGLLAGGGAKTIGNAIEGTGTALASSFIGGLAKAELAKGQFDAKVSDNFTVTLPGFMQQGADALVGIWDEAMGLLGLSSDRAGQSIVSTLTSAFSQTSQAAQSSSSNATSYLRNIVGNLLGGSSGGVDSAAQIEGALGSQPVLDSFGNVAGFESSASGIGVGAAGAGGEASAGVGAGAGAGAGLAAGLAGLGAGAVTAYLATNLITGVTGTLAAKQHISLQNQVNSQNLRESSGIWSPAAIGLAVAVPIVGQFYAIIAGLLEAAGIFDVPSKGTQLKIGLTKSLPSSFPRQRDVNIGGQTGVRTQFIEAAPTPEDLAHFRDLGFFDITGQTISRVPIAAQRLLPGIQAGAAANPGVDQLRYGAALGLGAVLARGPAQAPSYANVLTNDLLLSGVSEHQARSELLAVADKNKVTLDSGLNELQRRYLKGKFRDNPSTSDREDIKEFTASVAGLADLFSDNLPAGIDIAAIAMKDFTEKGGIDLAQFTDDLNRAKDIFGQLQDAEEQGLKTGFTNASAAIDKRNALIATGGSVSDIIKANNDATSALRDSLSQAVSDGMSTAIISGVFDAVKDTDAWKALTNQVAAAVTGGDVSKIPQLIGNVVGAAMPVLNAALAAFDQIQQNASVTPTALFSDADTLQQKAKDTRFGQLTPAQQQQSLRNELGGIDTQISALEAGGITPQEAILLEPLLQRRGQIGSQFIDQSGNYAAGSAQQQQLIQFGLAILDSTSDDFQKFGISQETALASNTTSLDRNTDALNRNTDAHLSTPKAPIALVHVGKSETSDQFGTLQHLLTAGLKDPRRQKKIKDFSRTR